VALLAVAFVVFLYFRSVWLGFLAFFLMATSYGCWIWGIQANALGIMLPTQIMTSIFFLLWNKTGKLIYLALCGALVCIGVFIHISTVYFAIGVFAAVLITNFFLRKASRKVKLIHMGVFTGIVLLIAGYFFCLQTKINQTSDPTELFHLLGNTTYRNSSFGHPLKTPLKSIKDNLVTGIMNVTNIWRPINRWESIPIFFQIAALVGLILTLLLGSKSKWRVLLKPEVMFFLLTSMTIFSGYMLTQAGTHYYVIAAVPNLMLFIFLLYSIGGPKKIQVTRQILMAVFCLATFVHSGFSHLNVFRGEDINDNDYYRESAILLNQLEPGENATYYRSYPFVYQNGNIRAYYANKFMKRMGKEAYEKAFS